MDASLIDLGGIGEVFKKKTVATLTLGIFLLIVSMYLNILKDNVGKPGIVFGIIIIVFALGAQAINWFIYWKKQLD